MLIFANFIILISSRRSGRELGQQLGFGGSLLPVLPPDDRPCTTLAPPTPNLLFRYFHPCLSLLLPPILPPTSTLAPPTTALLLPPTCLLPYSLVLPPPCSSYPPPSPPTPTSVHPYPSFSHSSSTPIILSLLLPTPTIVIRPFSSTSTCSTSLLSNHFLFTSFKSHIFSTLQKRWWLSSYSTQPN